ncbi:MAG: YigZ family protein [Saprospiraceae bacterium]|nr:YigZ family protein [Saprospiraceae bacterium]
MENYHSIRSECQSSLTIKGSKFIAIAFPVLNQKEAEEKLSLVKSMHPKARHWCYAWKTGFPEFSYKASDDGEPSGTAGKPILNQIERFGLTNIILIVVRYFGGILLGTGGLLKAYKESASSCLENAQPVLLEKKLEIRIASNAIKIQMLLGIIKDCGVPIKSFDMTTENWILVEIPLRQKTEFLRMVKSKLEKTNLTHIENEEDWRDCKISFREL